MLKYYFGKSESQPYKQYMYVHAVYGSTDLRIRILIILRKIYTLLIK